MQRNKSRRITSLFLLLFLIVICVLIVLSKLTTHETETHRSVQPSNSALVRNLTQSTTLGGNKLTDSKRNSLLKCVSFKKQRSLTVYIYFSSFNIISYFSDICI